MKTKYLPVILLTLYSLLSSCKDIIEPSLSDRTVTLQAPGNGFQSVSYSINFWWDEVEDALTYRLQVVTPDFRNIGGLVLDTVVKTSRFTVNLNPGNYEWRVQALNGSSQTAFSFPKNFIVVLGSIKGQAVKLTSPANSTITNQSLASFQWGNLYGATKYRLEIDTNSFSDEKVLVYDKSIPGQQINFTLPKDHIYQWRVRAENDTAQAQWSSINTITYDHTPPGQVSLTSPAKDQQVTLPVSLQWSAVTSASKYKLYILKSDSTTSYNSSFPMIVNTTNYNLTSGVLGERIYWKVIAIDGAGNEGQPSVIRNFVLK